MVTRSIDDFGQHIKDIQADLHGRAPKEKIDSFVDYYCKLYNKRKKTYLPWKLCLLLFNRRNWVIKNNQHYWIAFIGRTGGEGKSTLANNCMYFLDDTYTPDRAALNYEDFIKIVMDSYTVKNNPAITLDEPEDKTHPKSKEGRKLSDILGKIRQLNFFVAVCANSLTYLPRFIYDRLSAICYITQNHRFTMWETLSDRPKFTIIHEIKKEFKTKGHSVFVDKKILKRARFKNQSFSEGMPFSSSQYRKKKRRDLFKDINSFLRKGDRKTISLAREIRIQDDFKTDNFTQRELSKKYGITQAWVSRIVNKKIR